MAGRNDGVCHGCRRSNHLFADCPNKVSCPGCKAAYVKCFVVVKNTKNKGKFFKCCSNKCGFWEWVKEGEMTGESSSIGNSSTTHVSNNDVCSMFETMCRLTHEEDVEITVTIRKGNANVEHNKKGKGPA